MRFVQVLCIKNLKLVFDLIGKYGLHLGFTTCRVCEFHSLRLTNCYFITYYEFIMQFNIL